jgi:hypothetical protein
MLAMGLRFRRSFRVIPGVRLNVSRSGVSASIGRRGAWFTVGPKGTRATVGIPGTGLSYTEQSPWARTEPHVSPTPAPGIEVAELPQVEIEVPPAPEPAAAPAPALVDVDDDVAHADPRLLPIVLGIVALITAAAVLWAALV